jgi:hypothetical protein
MISLGGLLLNNLSSYIIPFFSCLLVKDTILHTILDLLSIPREGCHCSVYLSIPPLSACWLVELVKSFRTLSPLDPKTRQYTNRQLTDCNNHLEEKLLSSQCSLTISYKTMNIEIILHKTLSWNLKLDI